MHRFHTKPGFLGADEASHGLIGNLKTGWQHSIEILLGIRWYLSSRMRDYQLSSQQLGWWCCSLLLCRFHCFEQLPWNGYLGSHPVIPSLGYFIPWADPTQYMVTGPGSSRPQSRPSNLLDPQGIRLPRLLCCRHPVRQLINAGINATLILAQPKHQWKPETCLVGGFNHLEKYESQWEGLSRIWNGK
jgi:hypothetical protein